MHKYVFKRSCPDDSCNAPAKCAHAIAPVFGPIGFLASLWKAGNFLVQSVTVVPSKWASCTSPTPVA